MRCARSTHLEDKEALREIRKQPSARMNNFPRHVMGRVPVLKFEDVDVL